MGVKLFDIVPARPVTLKELRGKRLACDASLFLHQFLSSIRQPDGTLLMNRAGKVTSHLVGLFSRTLKLLEEGIEICYVFDGTPPALKQAEIERRSSLKAEAREQLREAEAAGDIDAMKRFSSRSVHLTPSMVEEAKRLLEYLGVPVIQAPSEAEAQAAWMSRAGLVWAVASQDADTLVFGAKRLVRNVSIAGRKKRTGTLVTQVVQPEIIDQELLLKELHMTQEQLIVLAMLIGTDFNIGGIPGIGPQKARKLLEKFGTDFDALFIDVKWSDFFSVPWKEVFDVFAKIPIDESVQLVWRPPREEELRTFLLTECDFAEQRVTGAIETLKSLKKERVQRGLGDFFG